ncbi:phosphoribosylanthranilate isomerase [Candidatus Stoquefichus massiliensis]|uniref:phosphoribosylanthranilate isomerase n=1 Tax=Candidatus Stoquefichus massiliensis TaxID=1470350 RepID=UPI0004874FA3|nr:phosphoribosylanthranilate isomerase [Candidatus Stoquefichus massiliensis]
MKIKICGLFREQDVKYVNQAMPDYIGFVFAKSKRQITIDQAYHFKKMLNPHILTVGVFVDAPISEIKTVVQLGIIDIVQLHGQEDQKYISQLKHQVHLPLIKAMTVEDIYSEYEDIDYYLFDSSNAGSGRCFDWTLIPQIRKPFFLAGGIRLSNIDEAIKLDCYGIDISSGVETHGYKDQEKINEIVWRVKNGNR